MPYQYSEQRLTSRFRMATTDIVAAVELNKGDLCYMNGTGKMDKADASVTATAETMLGIATQHIAADAKGIFALLGFFDTEGLTVGILYVGLTAGTWTSTKPNGSGEVVRIIGYAISATEMYFNPDRTWIELA